MRQNRSNFHYLDKIFHVITENIHIQSPLSWKGMKISPFWRAKTPNSDNWLTASLCLYLFCLKDHPETASTFSILVPILTLPVPTSKSPAQTPGYPLGTTRARIWRIWIWIYWTFSFPLFSQFLKKSPRRFFTWFFYIIRSIFKHLELTQLK